MIDLELGRAAEYEHIPYNRFAVAYDEMMSHVDYRRWVKYIGELFELYGVQPKRVLDLACVYVFSVAHRRVFLHFVVRWADRDRAAIPPIPALGTFTRSSTLHSPWSSPPFPPSSSPCRSSNQRGQSLIGL